MAIVIPTFGLTALALAASSTLYGLGYVFYNLWLHPLRNLPGPWYMRATSMGHIYHSMRGTISFDMLALHKQYGDVVRIGPNEVDFATTTGWQDIQGHRQKGQADFGKYKGFYQLIETMPVNILSADRQQHGMLRRTLSHGFSEKGMREQQPLISKYIDLLIQRLHENCDGGNAELDLGTWYNWTTFDVIGDLAFGEPFGCLQNETHHDWVQLIFKMARAGAAMQALSFFPLIKNVLLKLVPESAKKSAMEHENMAMDKVKRRMEGGKQRPDLINGLIERKDEWGITDEELASNAGLLVIAGSETTATLLTGVTYFLMKDPAIMKKVTDEVRTTFKSENEINFTSVNDLTYMLACLNEALRRYPPVAFGLPRETPEGGALVGDVFLPGGTVATIHHWALYHNDKYFKKPFEFRPERFLGDEEFKGDVSEVFQPFHVGPRNCIGRNLAYVEMRTILARILFSFDLTISKRSEGWLEHKNFNVWDKPPLYAHLTPRRR